MGNCNCLGNTPSNPSSSTKSGCLCFETYRELCSKGPEPCGQSFDIDLEVLTTNGINTDDLTYSVRSYDASKFTGAPTINAEGVMTVVSNGTGGEETLILVDASVDHNGRTYRITGKIYICFEDLCKGVNCPEGQECENCTGNCVDIVADLEV